MKKKKSKTIRTSLELDQEVYSKLSNYSDITEISKKGIVNQALRKFFGMPIPVIGKSNE